MTDPTMPRLPPVASSRAQAGSRRQPWFRHGQALTFGSIAFLAALGFAASIHPVRPGQALIVTLFGHPTRVVTEPGPVLAWPPPIGGFITVDTRLHATQGTPQILPVTLPSSKPGDAETCHAQPYAIWRVAADAASIKLFAQTSAAAGFAAGDAIRAMIDSALPAALQDAAKAGIAQPQTRGAALDAAGATLLAHVAPAARKAYGIEVTAASLMQLSPAPTHPENAEQSRAAAEAEAAQIRAEAERDSRIALAEAEVQAASIEADARKEAATIEGKAYATDPELYQMLRSLDTLSSMVGPSTRLVLRTDAAPFNVLVQGPPTEAPK